MKTTSNLDIELVIKFLKDCDEELKGRGYIPTLELLIEKLKEDDVKVEADRLTVHND